MQSSLHSHTHKSLCKPYTNCSAIVSLSQLQIHKLNVQGFIAHYQSLKCSLPLRVMHDLRVQTQLHGACKFKRSMVFVPNSDFTVCRQEEKHRAIEQQILNHRIMISTVLSSANKLIKHIRVKPFPLLQELCNEYCILKSEKFRLM